MGVRTKLFVLLSMTLTMPLFQNCSRADFGHSTASSSESVTGIPGTTPSLNPPNNPPGGTTVCAVADNASCDPDQTHAFTGNLYVVPRGSNDHVMGPRQHGDGTVNAPPQSSLAYLENSNWLMGAPVNGVFQPYKIALSPVDLAGSFANNFMTSTGQAVNVQDADGTNKSVAAWFALSLTAQFHLDNSAGDTQGTYQFALVSDDGSQLSIKASAGAGYQMIVDNATPESATDGYWLRGTQYTRMGCSNSLTGLDPNQPVVQTVILAPNQNVPMKLDYFNGPQGLTFQLLYRKVPAAGASDPYCETDVNSEAWVAAHRSPLVKQNVTLDLTKLSGSGWKIVGAGNLN